MEKNKDKKPKYVMGMLFPYSDLVIVGVLGYGIWKLLGWMEFDKSMKQLGDMTSAGYKRK